MRSDKYRRKLLGKMLDRDYRDSYIASTTRTGISAQIRYMRTQRGLTQRQLGALADKTQSAIARLEKRDHGRITVQSLIDMARAFDVALVIKMVSINRFWNEYEDRAPESYLVSPSDDLLPDMIDRADSEAVAKVITVNGTGLTQSEHVEETGRRLIAHVSG